MLSLCFLFEYMYFLFFFNKGSSLGLVSFKMISKEIFFVCLFLSSKYLYEVYISSFFRFLCLLGSDSTLLIQQSSLFLIYSLILVISFKLYVLSSIYLLCSVSWGLLDWHQVRKDMESFLKENV